jgi:predicted molibdopterin-dependent oxidoreductase YjgC
MLCVKGRFGTDYTTHPGRIRKPLIRANDDEPRSRPPVWREASWDEALELVAARLTETVRAHGPDSVAAFACAKATNEDNYLLQKLTRAVLGTNNIDHCSRLCHAGSVTGLQLAIGSSAMSNSIAEMENLDTFIVTGSNTTETHPVIANFLKRPCGKWREADRHRPAPIEMTDFATLWLRQRPARTWGLAGHGPCRRRGRPLQSGLPRRAHRSGFSDYVESLEPFTPEWAEAETGVPAADIRRAARMYATAKAASVYWGMGISQSTHGTDNTLAITNLALMCGHLGREGTGLNPLRGQNNVQGCSDSGGLPYCYTAYQRVDDPEVRRRFASAWNRPELNPAPGLMITELVDAVLAGAVRAWFVMGEDPLTSEPNLSHARHALEKLDLLVCQDIFINTTGEMADVILPSVSFAEKDGTFTNSDRRIQRVRTALPPVGDSRPDWEILCDLARRLESRLGQTQTAGWDYADPSEIWEEMRRQTPDFGGIDYARLDREGGVHWPCPAFDHPGSPFLFQDDFPRGRGKFWTLEFGTTSELPDDDYPFLLSTGRVLYHWHGGTLSRRSKLDEIWPEATAELHPDDAKRLGLTTGDWVEVASRRGAIQMRVMVTGRSPQGMVFVPFHFVEAAANVLTNDRLDPRAKIPDFKVCAVRLTPVAAPADRDPATDQPLTSRGAIKDQAALVH